MYEPHWGLHAAESRGGSEFFFAGPTHEESLARMHYLVTGRRRVGLLVGESGTGKSRLLGRLADELLRPGCCVAQASLLGTGLRETLWTLAVGLGATPRRRDDLFVLWRRVTDRLREHRYQQYHTVLLLDDADEASADVLSHVVRLAQLDPSPEAGLTIIVASRPDGLARLGSRLSELAELRVELPAWDEQETAEYVAAALSHAGRFESVLDDAGMQRLFQLSGGVPRRVKQLLDLALMAGAGQQATRIGAEMVHAVYEELSAIDLLSPTSGVTSGETIRV
jgi:general secretion pathway protein A